MELALTLCEKLPCDLCRSPPGSSILLPLAAHSQQVQFDIGVAAGHNLHRMRQYAAPSGVGAFEHHDDFRYWLARFDGDPAVSGMWESALAAPPVERSSCLAPRRPQCAELARTGRAYRRCVGRRTFVGVVDMLGSNLIYGILYPNANFTKLTIAVFRREEGGSGWGGANGLMISAPAQTRA